MIQCARCAASNQPTSKYCLTCGAPLPVGAQGQFPGPSGLGAPVPPLPPPGADLGGAPGIAQGPSLPQYFGQPAAPAPYPGFQSPAVPDPPPYIPTAPPPALDQGPSPSPLGYGPAANLVQATRPSLVHPGLAGRDPDLVEPGALRVLAGFLVSYDASEIGAYWPIYQGKNALGRRGAAPGLDIEIDHPTTSSRHAVLYASARPARLKLEDIGSTNGTFLRDQPLERGRRHELYDGDVVRFGGYSAVVKLV